MVAMHMTGGSTTPAGAVIAFAGSSAPTGYLLCDGSAISRSTYAALFAVVGTTYGAGNGTTTFNLPDFRGMFLQGAGTSGLHQDAAGNYFSATPAAYSADQMQGHIHSVFNAVSLSGSAYGFQAGGASQFQTAGSSGGPLNDGTNGSPRTGTNTKPASYGIYYIIKI